MDEIREPVCFRCKWFAVYPICLAFPDGIPEDILLGENDHGEPIEGDGGFQFALVERDRTATKSLGIKGGPGSGFHGHAGRPGEVGGSAPEGEGGVAVAVGQPDRIDQAWLDELKIRWLQETENGRTGTYTEVKDRQAEFCAMYNVDLYDLENALSLEGLSSDIEILYRAGYDSEEDSKRDNLVAYCTYRDQSGEEVGRASFNFARDGENFHPNLIEFEEPATVGAGSKVFDNMVALAGQSGYKKADMFCALDIGRYAWAKRGVQYRPGTDGGSYGGRLARWMSEKGIDPLPGMPALPDMHDYPPTEEGYNTYFDDIMKVSNVWKDSLAGKSVYEMATLTHPEGIKVRGDQIENPSVPPDLEMDIGKAFMLDLGTWGHGAWDGVLYLERSQ